MEHYRQDNTEGYAEAELAELNAAWGQITSHGVTVDDDDMATESMLGNWSETLLAEYDAGKRGDALVAWFYAP